MNLHFIIAALFVLLGGIIILQKRCDNIPLRMLSFFIIVYVFGHVNDSQLVWAVELFFILYIIKFKFVINGDVRWYCFFVMFAFFSLVYSDNPLRGIPGIVMYIFPLFYYALTNLAIRNTADIDHFFFSITNYIWLLLVLCVLSLFYECVFVYYGMGICTIPAYLFFKTNKKKYIYHLIICLLPAIFLVKRTPLLGISASMMVFSMLMFKWKAIIPSILAVVISMAIVVNIPSFREKLFYDSEAALSNSTDVTENVNMNGRLVFWSIVWEKIHKRSPYWGVGQGTVKAYLQSDQNEYKDTFMLMHNDWLLILCEQGLIGVSLLLFFMIRILRRCVKYSSKRYPHNLRLISATCAGSIVSTMIHMFFENCMNGFIFSTSFVFLALFRIYIKEYKYQLSK